MTTLERMACGHCPHFKTEPVWKQLLFVWRTGLWLGKCEPCFGIGLMWWPIECRRKAFSASEAENGQ